MPQSSSHLSPTAVPSPLSQEASSSRSNSPSRVRSPRSDGHPIPLSPRSSTIFASRPSPVVPSPSLPSSPASFSRPTSPVGTRNREAGEPSSPTRAGAHQPAYELGSSGMLSRSGSAVDLSHVFERDVEFGSTHKISAAEAVDVAIAPVLDEAALALSSDRQSRDLLRDSQDDISSSGWSSPVGASPAVHTGRHSYANASRSPTRSTVGDGGRSFSPSSLDGGRAATSPGASSSSFSVGTPPDDTLHPFSQHLSDALEKTEAARREGSPSSGSLFNPSQTSGEIILPPPVLASGGFSGSMLASPVPFPSSDSQSPGSIPTSPSLDTVNATGASSKARRLSFISYADVINEERLAELTGAPVGGEMPAGGGVVDLAVALDKLEIDAEQQKSLGLQSEPGERGDV